MNVKLAGKKYFTLFYTPHIFNGIEYMYFSFGIAATAAIAPNRQLYEGIFVKGHKKSHSSAELQCRQTVCFLV